MKHWEPMKLQYLGNVSAIMRQSTNASKSDANGACGANKRQFVVGGNCPK